MRRVLKWDVPVDDKDHPIGSGPVVLVGCQSAPNHVQVWTDEEDSAPIRMRAARVYGTGHPLPLFDEHVGSVLVADGRGAWHVFALPAGALQQGG